MERIAVFELRQDVPLEGFVKNEHSVVGGFCVITVRKAPEQKRHPEPSETYSG